MGWGGFRCENGRQGCLFALMMAACYTPPQTTQAWRDSMRVHRNGRVESWQLADDHVAVSDRVYRAFMQCFDVATEHCGGTSTSYSCTTIQYVPRAIEETPSRRTLTLQMQINALGPARRAPPGGMFMLVVDVESDGSGSKITSYGTRHKTHEPWFAALHEWSEGGPPEECPTLVSALREPSSRLAQSEQLGAF